MARYFIRMRIKLPDSNDLCALSASEQARAVRSGELRPRELVEASLARIRQIDPMLNCVRTTRDDAALAEADIVESRVRAGEDLPLAGVVTAVKDNWPIAGEISASGTASPESPAVQDSEVVKRLRTAGAVIVAITTMPELALWATTESPTFGVTRNPYDPSRSPGGSSGGSAAAVAASLVALAQGDDGGASIRVPAACCGLVGLKPQRGRIPTDPFTDRWYGLSHIGFLARDADDAELALCSTTRDLPSVQSLSETHIAMTLKPPLPVPVSAEVKAATCSVAERLADLGHRVEEVKPEWGFLAPAIFPRYLAAAAQEHAALVDPSATDRRTRVLAGIGSAVPDWMRARAHAAEPRHRERLNSMFGDADVLLTPTTTTTAPAAGELLARGAPNAFARMSAFIAFTAPWNLTGQPAISVPAGFDEHGVPIGAQLVARPGREDVLLTLAKALESPNKQQGKDRTCPTSESPT